jgi:hypothetical protein
LTSLPNVHQMLKYQVHLINRIKATLRHCYQLKLVCLSHNHEFLVHTKLKASITIVTPQSYFFCKLFKAIQPHTSFRRLISSSCSCRCSLALFSKYSASSLANWSISSSCSFLFLSLSNRWIAFFLS